MIRNGKDIGNRPQRTQVCVIGSGPAGITAAWELSKAGLDVILLEGSRELKYSHPDYFKDSLKDKEKLYAGKVEGIFSPIAYNPLSSFLTGPVDRDSVGKQPEERERVYGGTPTHGGGQCRPLDRLAFEKRPGFPGWPITRQELDPYYEKACTLNHLFGDYETDGFNFSAEFWACEMRKQGLKVRVPHLKGFNAEMYQFMDKKWVNFARRTFDENKKIDDSVDVIVNATLSYMQLAEDGVSVNYLWVASMDDDPSNPKIVNEFPVNADVYILACGAIENARELLLAEIKNKLVGRYFMCHPLTLKDVITTKGDYLTHEEYELMQHNPWNQEIAATEGRFTIADEIAREKGIGKCWFWPNGTGGGAQMYLEMAPNDYSYVCLANTCDPVFPRKKQTYIHWQLTELDQKTYETNCQLFDEALKTKKEGSGIRYDCWEQIINPPNGWIINGHHIGTTRMSVTPSDGVVDPNLKVHGSKNLYVAGSSVFPTVGTSNPTMTIVALSIRLAEHISTAVTKR